jgi:Animal haem peroxidase
MVFRLRTALIVDLFHTSHKDVNINLASSYLDLSPLYGSSQAEQDRIRTFKDGNLKVDAFVDRRLELFPPGVAALMICFNRFHNYVVQQLALINEGGRFIKPVDNSTAAEAKYDNDLFQTGRL